ncbi:MAG TPA: M28 family metallopeptidase [Vicinamibacterales bacterium]|nr:M28 family metallopeptidase [Vicinamibacterales bacterium]
MRAAGGLVVAVLTLVAVAASSAPSGDLIFGFTKARSAAQRDRERSFLASPSAERMRDAHRYLAGKPHIAGSPRDRELAEWTRDQFVAYGLEQVEITTHDVLLPYAQEVSVEMVSPRSWKASMREEPIPGDEYTHIGEDEAGIPYHAYSASGEVTAPVVYAGSGNPSDYDALLAKGIDIKGKIALVRYSVPYSYRGFKAMTAEKRGAAGILIYSDAEDDGAGKGPVYPDGPWGPESHIQRGGIVYDFLVPGDPLTPGWASVPGAKRIDRKDAVSLPRIISAPMSHKDAQVLLQTPGAVVRLRVKADDEIRPIWTVTGMIRGSESPEELVIVGNHRDAWIYGGVDPSSGSAALMELARTLGAQVRGGWRPKRSIVFASWDAEEFTLTSSTEWGEQHEARLKAGAVAYLNVDSATSGPNFSSAAVPALNRLIAEAAEAVQDPRSNGSIAAATRAAKTREAGALPTGGGGELTSNRLGSGSDYTVFLNFLGVPVADLSFDGPYGVYHSIYDNHHWVSRIGDPGFLYHVAMVQLWGLMTMRLADADVIPLDYEPYAARIEEFARALEQRWKRAGALTPLVREAAAMRRAAAALNADRERALAAGDAGAMAAVNRRLMAAERAFLEPDGIPGRPWYRHQVYAPKFTYAPELLPAIAEAVDEGDARRAEAQVRRVAATIARVAATLARR